MMERNFEKALNAVLKDEGGFVNHPKDPGGATNFGITQAVYSAWRRNKGQAFKAVALITGAEVADIYKAQYWDAVRGDLLTDGVDYVTFDGAVNSGPVQSIKWLQKALGTTADGHLGNVTLDRLSRASPATVIKSHCATRLGFLTKLKTWKYFGRGWNARMARVQALGLKIARGEG